MKNSHVCCSRTEQCHSYWICVATGQAKALPSCTHPIHLFHSSHLLTFCHPISTIISLSPYHQNVFLEAFYASKWITVKWIIIFSISSVWDIEFERLVLPYFSADFSSPVWSDPVWFSLNCFTICQINTKVGADYHEAVYGAHPVLILQLNAI